MKNTGRIGRFRLVAWVLALLWCCFPASAELAEDAVRGMTARLLPEDVDAFLFESIPHENGLDVFEVEGRRQGGPAWFNGCCPASALNWYLKTCCGVNVSLEPAAELPDRCRCRRARPVSSPLPLPLLF